MAFRSTFPLHLSAPPFPLHLSTPPFRSTFSAPQNQKNAPSYWLGAFNRILPTGFFSIETVDFCNSFLDFQLHPCLRRDRDSNPGYHEGITIFETAAFDHSAISPTGLLLNRSQRYKKFYCSLRHLRYRNSSIESLPMRLSTLPRSLELVFLLFVP